jgi:hypothetical protein
VIVNVIVKKQMECRLAGETEVLGENLPITKPHMTRPGFELFYTIVYIIGL